MAKTVADRGSQTALIVDNSTLTKILHIDDSENSLIITKRQLEKIGPFQVDSVLSVRDAYKNLEQKKYDVIISDYIMPERNGIDLLKQLRNDGNNIPFILFTGTNRKEVIIEALNLGAYRYFNKNENPDTLYIELAHSLKLVKTINDCKKAEIELKKSETKFWAIAASVTDGIILLDNLGKIAYWNPASEKIFGYTEKEVINKNLHMLLAPEHFQDKICKGFTRFKETGEGNAVGEPFEVEGVNKDGKPVPIEISLSALQLDNKWFALALVRDNSERKTAWESLEETINELVKINEKLGVVGRLTRHDARNKLTIILNNIFLAKKRVSEDPIATGFLESVNLAVCQMKKIFEFAHTYEMVGIEELTNSNVEKSFKEAATLFSEYEHIHMIDQTTGLTVLADSLLRQLFYNLIHNSIVHGKTVTQIKLHYKKEPNKLQLIYEDNGEGIPNTEKKKIFGEGHGKGTGYGLYLINKICENYGWTIQETGEPTEGAKFVMTIPKNDRKGTQLYCFAVD